MHVRFVAISLVLALVVPQIARSQSPNVSRSELRKAIETATMARQKNLAQAQSFFSSEPARAALNSAKVDYQKVQKAISTLSADELARLASRTQQIQTDLAGGALSNQELTYIVVALAAAVIVLIAIAA